MRDLATATEIVGSVVSLAAGVDPVSGSSVAEVASLEGAPKDVEGAGEGTLVGGGSGITVVSESARWSKADKGSGEGAADMSVHG